MCRFLRQLRERFARWCVSTFIELKKIRLRDTNSPVGSLSHGSSSGGRDETKATCERRPIIQTQHTYRHSPEASKEADRRQRDHKVRPWGRACEKHVMDLQISLPCLCAPWQSESLEFKNECVIGLVHGRSLERRCTETTLDARRTAKN